MDFTNGENGLLSKVVLKPTKLKRAIMPLGFFKGGLEGKPAWHPWTMSPGICQGGSLGTHATVKYVCILGFTFALIIESKVSVMLKSWQRYVSLL